MRLPLNLLMEKLPEAGREHWPILDSTKLQSFAACPRQYFFEYVLGWRSDRPSNHLVFGQAWHSALEYLYSQGNFDPATQAIAFRHFLATYRKEFPETTDEWFGGKTPLAALEALVEYCQNYASDLYAYKVLATEVIDQLDITGTGEYVITVKLDGVFQDTSTNKIVIMEHKTGSSSGQYWATQWHLSLQVGAYIAACNHYYGQDETPCIVDGIFFLKTKRNFQREIVIRSADSMKNWENTVVTLMDRIEANYQMLGNYDDTKYAIQKSFSQNPGACSNYGGCQFHELCTCNSNPLALYEAGGRKPPIGYKEFWWNPLAQERKDG